MDPRGRPVYKESTPWPGWILVVFWGTMVLAMGAVHVAGDESHDERVVGAVVLGVVAVAVQWLVAGLSVRLYRDLMVVGLGPSGWSRRCATRRSSPWSRCATTHPRVRGMGGPLRQRRQAGLDGPGRRAVVLHLEDGTHSTWAATIPTGWRSASAPWPATGSGPRPGGDERLKPRPPGEPVTARRVCAAEPARTLP